MTMMGKANGNEFSDDDISSSSGEGGDLMSGLGTKKLKFDDTVMLKSIQIVGSSQVLQDPLLDSDPEGEYCEMEHDAQDFDEDEDIDPALKMSQRIHGIVEEEEKEVSSNILEKKEESKE